MTFRLHLLVEGPTDAADGRGALEPLVRAVLAHESGISPDKLDRVLEPGTATPIQNLRKNAAFGQRTGLSPHARKLGMEVQRLLEEPDTLVVAVWDSDGRKERLEDARALNASWERQGETRAAAGVAVQAIEAWLLADAQAFQGLAGRSPASGLPGRPEDDPTPKDTLRSVLDQVGASADDAQSVTYRRLAQAVNIAALGKRCPTGFGALAKTLSRSLAVALRHRLRG